MQQWLHSYPHNLTQAITLTSPTFRNDLTPAEWVAHHSSILKNLRLKYLDSRILKEERDGSDAVIQVKVWIDTIVGEQVQVEQYDLHRYCSVWLLENIRVLNEHYLGHTM